MQSVEPPLYSHPMTSEYRKQFVWKEPIKRELRYVIPVSDISQDEERKVDEDKKIRKYKPFRTEYQLQFKNYPLSKESQPESKNTPVVSENQQFEEKGECIWLYFGICIISKRFSFLRMLQSKMELT